MVRNFSKMHRDSACLVLALDTRVNACVTAHLEWMAFAQQST